MKRGYTYILTNFYNGTLYIGVTSDIARRIGEHKTGVHEGFSRRYKLKRLVYLEEFTRIEDAILREKQLKRWKRQWKINLINRQNPEWRDLAAEMGTCLRRCDGPS